MDLNVFEILEKTAAEGPGIRFCIWVQGCSRHCEGCYAKDTWDKTKGKLISVNDLFTRIKASKQIEGITFLGGEPFEQANAVGELAMLVKKLGLSVVTFTGNNYEELCMSADKNIKKLLKNTDLLIDGAFDKDKIDYKRPWVGSTNQKYRFLTDRYSFADIENANNKVEIRISKSGDVLMNGMGDFDKILRNLSLVKKF